MDTDAAIALIVNLLAQVDVVLVAGRSSSEFAAWRLSGALTLTEIFGAKHLITRNFANMTYYIPTTTVIQVWDPNAEIARLSVEAFKGGVEAQRGILESAVEHLKRFGLTPIPATEKPKSRVFVSHGSADEVLDRVSRFIADDLGLDAVVVKRQPSLGGAVDDTVPAMMDSCDAVVVLATADDQVEGGVRQPRPNVIHEIGLAQEKMANRVIYLKEDGVTFPSNVAPKIWETFTRTDYAPAFSKIARELRAMNLL